MLRMGRTQEAIENYSYNVDQISLKKFKFLNILIKQAQLKIQ